MEANVQTKTLTYLDSLQRMQEKGAATKSLVRLQCSAQATCIGELILVGDLIEVHGLIPSDPRMY